MEGTSLREAIARELDENLLPFWRERCRDSSGGFIAEMAVDGTVRADAPHGLILNSRLLWTFAALYRRLGDERDLALAKRAYEVLESRFRDSEHGGYFWRIDAKGRPTDRIKKTYGQAFCIYALSEYYLATGDDEALEAATELAGLLDHHTRDSDDGGYVETRAADWLPEAEPRLSDRDLIAPRSMNNHLHLLEAFTNLQRARATDANKMRLYELVEVFGREILEPDGHGLQLQHFFDDRWRCLSDTRTYGHDIEAAWLLDEAAEVLGDLHLQSRVDTWSVSLARSVRATGVDRDGGLAYEGRGDGVINGDRDWWCQAEAVVGFWHVYKLTGDPEFAEAAAGAWQFIDTHQADRHHGEWFWRVRADGTIDENEPKVSEWKGPYHTVRMCLEMMRRLDEGAIGEKA